MSNAENAGVRWRTLWLCLRLYFRESTEGDTAEDEECRTLEARAKRRQACLLEVIFRWGWRVCKGKLEMIRKTRDMRYLQIGRAHV